MLAVFNKSGVNENISKIMQEVVHWCIHTCTGRLAAVWFCEMCGCCLILLIN